jgi:hypothetical protein
VEAIASPDRSSIRRDTSFPVFESLLVVAVQDEKSADGAGDQEDIRRLREALSDLALDHTFDLPPLPGADWRLAADWRCDRLPAERQILKCRGELVAHPN